GGTLRHAAVPLLDVRRRQMVEPSAPVVPGDEDDGPIPKASCNDRLDLMRGPQGAVGHVLRWMLRERWLPFGVEPGNGGDNAGRRVMGEQNRGEIDWMTGEVFDGVECGFGVCCPPCPSQLDAR